MTCGDAVAAVLLKALLDYLGDGVYFSYILRVYHQPEPLKWWQFWREPQSSWHEDIDLERVWLDIEAVGQRTIEFSCPPTPKSNLNIQGYKIWLEEGELLWEDRWRVGEGDSLGLTGPPTITV